MKRPVKGNKYAFIYVILAFTASVAHAQVDEQDSLVLVKFYNDLNGPEWTNNSGWLEGPVASWFGVEVDAGRVTGIELPINNMKGELPSEIGALTGLSKLILYINEITGDIPPEIGELINLREFSISKNDLTGTIPAEITLLSELKELNVLSNQLEGPLPDLSPLQNLEALYLDQNDFAGPFPPWLLDMPELKELSLRSVGLTGNLPPDFFRSLPNLESLRIGSNNLGGDIAVWYRDSSQVQSFDIYNNRFSGVMADGVIDPNVSTFSISGNLIEGIPDFSGADATKAFFLVDNNKLDFTELAKADSVETFFPDRLVLGPQKRLLARDTMYMKPGDEVSLMSGSSHEMDIYQWYKDGSPITGATGRELVMQDYADTDAGEYYCRISNPDFEFDLERERVLLVTDGATSVADLHDADFSVVPNPACDFITITGVNLKWLSIFDGVGREVIRSAQSIIDVSGLTGGVYAVVVESDTGGKSVQRFVKL